MDFTGQINVEKLYTRKKSLSQGLRKGEIEGNADDLFQQLLGVDLGVLLALSKSRCKLR